jgi:hypothetical protein
MSRYHIKSVACLQAGTLIVNAVALVLHGPNLSRSLHNLHQQLMRFDPRFIIPYPKR